MSAPHTSVLLDEVIAALAIASVYGPWVLWNRTDSEPIGVYARTLQRPEIGRLIADGSPRDIQADPDVRRVYLGQNDGYA